MWRLLVAWFFFFQAEDGIRDLIVTGVQTCALPIWTAPRAAQAPKRRPSTAFASPSDGLTECAPKGSKPVTRIIRSRVTATGGSRRPQEHLRGLHEGLRQRRMGVDRQGEVLDGQRRLDRDGALCDQLSRP